MLRRATQRTQPLAESALRSGLVDVPLAFPDDTFDAAVATFVFCSVPDPVLGLREVRRVVRPGGQLLLLEHMRSPDPRLAALMDLLNPLVAAITGANINRPTLENVERAGWDLRPLEDLGAGGIFKLIEAVR